jgi:hypothetical protein
LLLTVSFLFAEVLPGFRVEAGGSRVHTHTCAAVHPLGARQCHHRLVTAGCFLLVPPQHFLLVPAHRVRVRLRLLCLSALPLAVTTHAALAAKVAVEQRLQRLPPRSPLPSALGLAAVKPRPPHALRSP